MKDILPELYYNERKKEALSMTYKLCNAAQLSTALSFSPQVALDFHRGTVLGDFPVVPPGLEILDAESYRLTFHAPTAQAVTVQIVFDEYPLKREADGLWSITLPIGSGGFQTLTFRVDGVRVIHPMLNIGFGASASCNFVDLPQPGIDFYHLKGVPHGAVSQVFYPSSVTGHYESCLVYTPPGYATGNDHYPVLYLQHGHGENEHCWIHQGKVNFILDNLIASGDAMPCIIVMNNGMVQTQDSDGSLRVDSMLLPELLVKDCIPYIERTYRVKCQKEHRAIAGLSMGSLHASILSMTYPELFAWVGIFSGFIQTPPLLKNGNDHLDALKDPHKFRSNYRLFFRAIGESDVFIDRFLSDRALLQNRSLSPEDWENHIERMYPGNHEWNVWRLCIRDFLKLIFR